MKPIPTKIEKTNKNDLKRTPFFDCSFNFFICSELVLLTEDEYNVQFEDKVRSYSLLTVRDGKQDSIIAKQIKNVKIKTSDCFLDCLSESGLIRLQTAPQYKLVVVIKDEIAFVYALDEENIFILRG